MNQKEPRIIDVNDVPHRIYLSCNEVEDVFYSEMYYLFENLFQKNYKVFFINCRPNHSIKIPTKDYTYLTQKLTFCEWKDIDNKYVLSNEVINLKDYQFNDINQLYNTAIQTNNIGAFFIHPKLYNDYYCFDFFLITNNKFNLNDLFDINFNLIKINSIIEHKPHSITKEFISNFFDLSKVIFKDYYLHNKSDVERRLDEEDGFLQNKYWFILFDKYSTNEPGINMTPSQINDLTKIWKNKAFIKSTELWDINKYKKLRFIRFCNQFYFFRKGTYDFGYSFVLYDENFDNFNDDLKNPNLIFYPLNDIFNFDAYQALAVCEEVYQWRKK